MENAERGTATLLNQGKTWNVGKTVADINHILKWHSPRGCRHLFIYEIRVCQCLLPRKPLVDLKHVTGLLSERHAALNARNKAGAGVFINLASVDLTKMFLDNLTASDNVKNAAGDDVEFNFNTWESGDFLTQFGE